MNDKANGSAITIHDDKGKERMILPSLPPLPDGARLDVEIHGDFGEIVKALISIDMPAVEKRSKNSHLGNKYASLEDMVTATRPALKKAGLAILQTNCGTTNGIAVVTILGHTSGAYVRGTLFLPVYLPVKGVSDEQAFGKAATYARRYGYQAMLSIAAEEDDDGHAVRDWRDADRAPRQQQNAPPSRPKDSRPYDVRMHAATTMAALVAVGRELNDDPTVDETKRGEFRKIYAEQKEKLSKPQSPPPKSDAEPKEKPPVEDDLGGRM